MPDTDPTRPATTEAPTGEWVIEPTDPNAPAGWWTNSQGWVGWLDDADIYDDADKASLTLPLDGKWVVLYRHEQDGCPTTEACPGARTCQDCIDVRRSVA